MLQQINEQLFLLINGSPSASPIIINFAIFCAQNVIHFVGLAIVWFIFFKPDSRLAMMKMVITVLVALLVCYIIRHFYYSPRPFTIGLGTNFLSHSNSSSLPSQHATVIWAIAMSFCFNYKKLFVPMIIIGLFICWSRIYVGVHWPLDIVLALVLSSISAWLVSYCWPIITRYSLPLLNKYTPFFIK